MIIGDFNQVKFIDQKLGGSSYLHRQEHFSRWRLGADSTKISYHGPKYTWCSNKDENAIMYEQLDRMFATNA